MRNGILSFPVVGYTYKTCLKKYGNADCFYLDATDDCYGQYTLGDGDTHCHVLCPMVFPSGKEVPEEIVLQLRKKLEEMKVAR